MDIIRCDEPEYLVWKWHPKGNTDIYRENSIRWGSSLRVREGSVAAFIYSNTDGGQDFIEGPYDGIIRTQNFPVLAGFVEKLYGGGSPFQAEVYFINLANIIQLPIGVPYFDIFDPNYDQYPIPVAVRGSLNFHITDYRHFIKVYRMQEFNLTSFKAKIKDAITEAVKDVVIKAPESLHIPAVQIERHIVEIRSLIEKKLAEVLQNTYAVSITSMSISAIEIDKNSTGYKKLLSITQNKGAEFVHKAASTIESFGLHRSGAKVIKEAKNARLGVESATQKIGNLFSKKGESAPSLPSDGFFIAVNGKQTGPYNTDKLLKMARKGTLTRESLVWKEGMADWKKAVDVEDLSSVISTIPPEL